MYDSYLLFEITPGKLSDDHHANTSLGTLLQWVGGGRHSAATMWKRLDSVKQRSNSHLHHDDDALLASATARTASKSCVPDDDESVSESHVRRVTSGGHRLATTFHFSNGFPISKSGNSSRFRVVVAALVFLRFIWNITWLHDVGVPNASSQGLNNPFVPSYTPPGRQIASIEEAYHNRNNNVPVQHEEIRENDEKILVFVETPPVVLAKRLSRSARTRPSIHAVTTDKFSNGISEPLSIARSTQSHPNLFDFSLHKNWTRICAAAGLDSGSRVLISGAVSNPLGHALALLMGRQCNVKNFLVIDSLYPPFKGSERTRIAQLDRYKILKRALHSVQLLTPPLLGTASTVAWHQGFLQRTASAFEPSHLIHLETILRIYRELADEATIRMFAVRTSLFSFESVLKIQASLRNASSMAPKLVYVTACNASMATSVRLQSALFRSYLHIHDLDSAWLQIPCVYGPLVGGLEDYEKSDHPLYIDDALSGVLRAFSGESREHTTGNQSSDVNKLETELDESSLYRFNETRSWKEGTKNDLADALVDAEYHDVYGVPKTKFPCSSCCESAECLPLALDKIQNVTRGATSSCDYVTYFVDLSRRFSEECLYRLRRDDHESEYSTCRVAFVSSHSRLTRQLLLTHEDYSNGLYVSEDEIQRQNGKQIVKDWLLIFLPDFSSDADRDLSMALLRIDPSRVFHRNVVKALYAEAPAVRNATLPKLEATFDEMTRYRTGKYFINVRRQGVNGVTRVLIPSQKSRKVIFYAREPKPSQLPDSLVDFVANAKTDVSQRQVEFYADSAATIPARLMRTSVAKFASSREDARKEIARFPFQWLSSGVYVHDLKMRHSHEFRCMWLKEYMFWGGSIDAELLSFAYVFGKLQLEQRIGQRLVDLDEASWIPLLNPADPDQRLRNVNDWEVFIRILIR